MYYRNILAHVQCLIKRGRLHKHEHIPRVKKPNEPTTLQHQILVYELEQYLDVLWTDEFH